MAELNINGALEQLRTTVGSINNKVKEVNNHAAEYKRNILERLSQVVEQLREVQNNPNLKNVPKLQEQLTEKNNALQQKTDELAAARQQLEQSNTKVEELNKTNAELLQQIDQKNEMLKQKEEELAKLQAANNEASAKLNDQIKNLQAEIDELKQQKTNVEQQLAARNQELSDLVRQIGMINGELNETVKSINQIAASLGTVDSPEMADQFKFIANNIEAIVKMINGEQGSAPPQHPSTEESVKNVEQQYKALTKEELAKLTPEMRRDIESTIRNKPEDWKNKVKNTLANQGIIKGGRKRNRNKKRTRKMRRYNISTGYNYNLKGGYVYTSSRKLDKSSSIVSDGTRASSPKTKSSYKTATPESISDSVFKRKTRKTSFRKKRTTQKHRHQLRK
jgi:chromosome segregation protein